MSDLKAEKKAVCQEKVGLMYEQLTKGVHSAPETTKLLEDMRKMVNNPEYADITFLCEDGECVVACRLLLVARSHVFKKMLMNGMAETHQSVIPMPNVSSSVLLVVLEFLYVGDIRKHLLESPLLQWSLIFAVASAARFFMLEALEAIACRVLWKDLVRSIAQPYTDEVVRTFGCRLSAACEFTSLLKDDNDVGNLDMVCMELVEFLRSADLTEDHLRTFGDQGFYTYILHTESIDKDDGTISFREYVRVRQLIMWCNTRIPQELQLRDFDSYLPAFQTVTRLLNDNDAQKMFESEFLDRNHHLWWGKVSPHLPPFLLATLLALINLSLLHPAILIRFVEPLELFPQADVIKALKVLSFDWNSDWKSKDSSSPSVQPWSFIQGCYYTGSEDVRVLHRGLSDMQGSAINGLAIPPYGQFEWDITLLTETRESLQVGFVSFYKTISNMNTCVPPCLTKSLVLAPSSWALTLRPGFPAVVSNNNICTTSKNWSLPMARSFGKKSKAVRVHLNRFENTCSFSYNGVKSGAVWSDLPHGIFYPAVSFFSKGSRPLSVRITLVRGLEYLR